MRSYKYLSCVFAVHLLAALQFSPAWAEDDTLEIQHEGDIAYVSGGVGSDESAALEAVQHQYNLRIMSSDKTGHYSGDMHLVVSDLKHHPLLDIIGGPIVYANLPVGRYIVEGENEGQRKKLTVAITAKSPARVHFTWIESPADTINY